MVDYHVHYRTELQSAIKHLLRAIEKGDEHKNLENSFSRFYGCIRGLGGHIQIEERRLFPKYIRMMGFPKDGIKFLDECHRELEKSERDLESEYRRLYSQEKISKDDLQKCLGMLLKFDEDLNQHLGEEEDMVTPCEILRDKYKLG